MSENIPESVPTSSDRRSQRPTKKRALDPLGAQSASIEALFAHPERAVAPNGAKERMVGAPPEIVANVQGSSAGAGSGEFHVYKASRRREYERLRVMDEEKETEDADAKFEAERAETKKRDAEKTSKNKARRDKAKQRKGKANAGDGMNVDGSGAPKSNGASKLQPNAAPNNNMTAGHEGWLEQDDHPVDEIGIVIHDED